MAIDRNYSEFGSGRNDNIYKYTDKVIKLVKPKKLIYFAIDGVAPRAKMN